MRILYSLLTLAALLSAKNIVTKITWADLPAAVQAEAKKQKTPAGAKVAYVKLVRDGGATFFEMKIDGTEILFRPDGSIQETEEVVPIESIPAAARAAIEKAAQRGKILKVDRVNRAGKVFYEGEILVNGVKEGPIFNAEGKRVE